MHREHQEGKCPNQVVSPAEMIPLVREHIPARLLVQTEGNVNLWPNKAQNEGGADLIGLIDIVPEQNGRLHPAAEPEVADHAVGQ